MKKGFTLIELLAVIVILAIIALIATPIILGIINDARDSSNERSAELYITAVEQAIVRKNFDGEFNPAQCTIENSVVTCDGTPLNVEVNGEKPTTGTIVLEKGRVASGTTLNFSGFTATVNEKNKIEIGEATGGTTPKIICTLQSGTAETVGSKYSCDVNENTTHTFYMLSTNNNGTINLIMDRNICEDGTPATALNKCLVQYNSSGDASGTGPATAMEYLNNATINWDDNLLLNETYDDEGGHFTGFVLNGHARLPKYEEVSVSEVGCTISDHSCPPWVVNALDTSYYIYDTEESILELWGYWTLSTSSKSTSAWFVHGTGYINTNTVKNGDFYGVRPVITVSTTQLG